MDGIEVEPESRPLVVVLQRVANDGVHLAYELAWHFAVVAVAGGYLAELLEHLVLVGQQQCRGGYLAVFLLDVVFVVLQVHRVDDGFLFKTLLQLAVLHLVHAVALEDVYQEGGDDDDDGQCHESDDPQQTAVELRLLLEEPDLVVLTGDGLACLSLGHFVFQNLLFLHLVLLVVELEVAVCLVAMSQLLVGLPEQAVDAEHEVFVAQLVAMLLQGVELVERLFVASLLVANGGMVEGYHGVEDDVAGREALQHFEGLLAVGLCLVGPSALEEQFVEVDIGLKGHAPVFVACLYGLLVEGDALIVVGIQDGLVEVDAVELEAGLLVVVACQVEQGCGFVVAADLVEELHQEQVAVAEEVVVLIFLEDGYGSLRLVVALEILSEAVVVASQLVAYAGGIVVVGLVVVHLQRFLQKRDTLRWLGAHLRGAHTPVDGPDL